jgi:hypothetical protein
VVSSLEGHHLPVPLHLGDVDRQVLAKDFWAGRDYVHTTCKADTVQPCRLLHLLVYQRRHWRPKSLMAPQIVKLLAGLADWQRFRQNLDDLARLVDATNENSSRSSMRASRHLTALPKLTPDGGGAHPSGVNQS